MTVFGWTRGRLAAVAGAALLLLAGTAAVATASRTATPAKTPSKLAQAKSQLAAAVKAGWLTPSQAAAIQSGLNLLQGTGSTAPGAGLDLGVLGSGVKAAQSYLGLSAPQLFLELLAGKSLAEIATAQGKTASGLVQAVVAAEKPQLSAAVKSGRITSSQAAALESGLQRSLGNAVKAKLPADALAALGSGLFGSA